MTADWQLHVRDRFGDRVAMVTEYDTATFIQRYNAVGTWMIDGIPMDTRAGMALVPGASIEAVRDGVTVLSGPMTKPTVHWSQEGYALQASGTDDNLLLLGRLCYPDAPSLNLNADYSDDRSGVAESVMWAYVDVNLGPTADTTRQQDVGMGADFGRGNAVSYSARLTVLLDVLAQLALPEVAGGVGLGFRIVAVDPDVFGYSRQFSVYEPSDLTTTVRFSPALGNLAERTYDREMAETNFVVVGGGGDGVLRTFVEASNSASIVEWGLRMEGFVDQRQTTVVDELQQAGADELATKGDQTALTLQPVDTAGLAYGTDYNLGDVVRVFASDTVTVDEVMREVKFDLTGTGGELITPLVGTPGAQAAGTTAAAALDVLFSQQAAVAQRLGRLERAQ